MSDNIYLPISLNINKYSIVMIGGGKVALHKLIALSQFTSNITVIAQEFHPKLTSLTYKCIQKSYEPGDLQGFKIAYACTNNRVINKRIYADSRALGMLVNVADDPELCDFISPAIHKENEMSIAVSSGGIDVKKAVAWRNKIRDLIQKNELK